MRREELMDEQVDSPNILWIRRTELGGPNSALVKQVLRTSRCGAFVDIDRNTTSHIAVVVGISYRRDEAREIIETSRWTIDDDYTPTEEEITEREARVRRRQDEVLRPITDVTGSSIDALFGEQPRGRVIGKRHVF